MRKEQFPLMNSQLQGGKRRVIVETCFRYLLLETIQSDTMCFINMVYLLPNIGIGLELKWSSQVEFDSLLVAEHTRKSSEVNYAKGSRRYGVIECDPLVRKGLEKTVSSL
ncbi:hypothetical protein CXB51_031506 [Gossypium anomalum]|uniref:Uncharacterized protein n=1 Tax=Gossypium anomalum TaxID=47600 RepID=A0A8J6CH33_9ROSI|nr:hypothetical protein CXB51_031506 [Gossypium anomalum]